MKVSKTLLTAFLIICFSCSSNLSYEEKVQNYSTYIKQSHTSFKEGKYEEALSYSNAAIAITDTVPAAIYLKGLALFELNLFDEAEENFSKVIKIEGESSAAYRERAKVHLKTGDSDFMDDINTYLENYPNNEEALLLKRDYLEVKEDFEGAIIEYSIAIAKNKDDLDLLTRRADLYFKNGDYQESVQDYEQILKLDPENNKIEIRKEEILALLNTNSNRNIFIAILILIYLIYVGLSLFVFKPIVIKKAITQIGGELEVSKDPLIWFLPIMLTSVFLYLFYSDLIPKF